MRDALPLGLPVSIRGASPLGLPTRSLTRRFVGALRSRGSLASARSRVGRRPRAYATTLCLSDSPYLSEGLCPSDSPTRSLARRFVGALQAHPKGFAPRTPQHALSRAASSARSVRVARSQALARGWATAQAYATRSCALRLPVPIRGASPLGLPDTLSRAPLRRRAARTSEGLRPSDSPARSLARRFVGALRSRGSLRSSRVGRRPRRPRWR